MTAAPSGAVVAYAFREPLRGGAIVCVAPDQIVARVFGGGGAHCSDGLAAAFGGYAYYGAKGSNDRYLGVWGQRNASRFRRLLREHGYTLKIALSRPPHPPMYFSVA